MKNKLNSAKNHVIRNRGKYAALATLTVCVALHRAQVVEMNTFLTKHGLIDEYYALDEE